MKKINYKIIQLLSLMSFEPMKNRQLTAVDGLDFDRRLPLVLTKKDDIGADGVYHRGQ